MTSDKEAELHLDKDGLEAANAVYCRQQGKQPAGCAFGHGHVGPDGAAFVCDVTWAEACLPSTAHIIMTYLNHIASHQPAPGDTQAGLSVAGDGEDEALWVERSRANAAEYAAGEDAFFAGITKAQAAPAPDGLEVVEPTDEQLNAACKAFSEATIVWPSNGAKSWVTEWFDIDAQAAVEFGVLKKPEWHYLSDARAMEFEWTVAAVIREPMRAALKSAANARIAAQQAEIEGLRKGRDEVRGLINDIMCEIRELRELAYS